MLNNSKLNESPSKHLRNDSKDNSIYEQGLGENYDKSHWQMPKDDAFVIEDVEKMQRRMEEFDRHDGIIRQDSDLSALQAKPKLNTRIDVRRADANKNFSKPDHKYVGDGKDHGDLSNHYENQAFAIDSVIPIDPSNKEPPLTDSLNQYSHKKSPTKSNSKSPSRSPGKSPGKSPGRSPGKRKKKTSLQVSEDSSESSSADDDKFAESIKEEDADIEHSQYDEYDEYDEQNRSVAELVDATTNQKWLDRIKRNNERRGTINPNLEDIPIKSDRSEIKDETSPKNQEVTPRHNSDQITPRNDLDRDDHELQVQTKKKFVIPEDFGLHISLYGETNNFLRHEKIRSDHPLHWLFIKNPKETKRQNRIMIMQYVNIVNESIQAVFTLLSVFTYFMLALPSIEDNQSLESNIEALDIVCCVVVLPDMVKTFIEASDKCLWWFEFDTVINTLSTIPFFIVMFQQSAAASALDAVFGAIGFTGLLQIFRILRVFRLIKIISQSGQGEDAISNFTITRGDIFFQSVFIFGTILFAQIFIGGAMSFELDDMFGFGFRVLVYDDSDIAGDEMSTAYTQIDSQFLGLEILLFNTFGNAFPVKYWSRIWIAGYVIVNIYISSQQMMAIIKEYTELNDFRYRFEIVNPHIVIMGKLRAMGVWRMLNDIVNYFEAHETVIELPEILIVQNELPSPEFLAICQYFIDNFDDCMVRYLCVSLSENELREFAHLKDASYIYYLNDTQDTSLFTDYEVFMIIQTIENLNIHAKKLIQINIPMQNSYLREDFGQSSRVNIMSIPFLRSTILGSSVFNPGILCLYQNLLWKIEDYPYNVPNNGEIPWVLDYCHGAQQESYIVKFSPYFFGKKFGEIVHDIYFSRQKNLNFSTVLQIGVKSFNAASQRGTILINPFRYVIQPNDYAVVIANNIEEAMLVECYEDRVSLKFTGTIFKRPLLPGSKELKGIHKQMKKSTKKIEDFICRLDEPYYKIWMGQGVVEKIKGHILIYGPSVYLGTVCDLIRKRTQKPICYVTMGIPDRFFEVQVKRFENIYFFQCDVLDITDLYRVGMKDAYHLIVFGSHALSSNGILDDDVTLILCNIMECYFENVKMSFELFEEPPLKYQNPKPSRDFWSESKQYFPKFYAGEIWLNSIIDHIMAQLPMYDTNLEVLESLLKPNILATNEDATKLDEKMLLEFMEKNLEVEYGNESYILSDYQKFIENRVIYTLDVPKKYLYLPWCKLFNDMILLDVHVIPLGLITNRYCMGNRAKDINKKEEENSPKKPKKCCTINDPKENIMDSEFSEQVTNDVTQKSLFITNPFHNTRLVPGDKIVIIGEIFTKDLKVLKESLVKLDKSSFETKEFRNEFIKVDKKAGIRNICISNIQKRLGGVDREALDAKIKRKNVKIKKTKAIINRMKKIGRRKRRYNQARKDAQEKAQLSSVINEDLDKSKDIQENKNSSVVKMQIDEDPVITNESKASFINPQLETSKADLIIENKSNVIGFNGTLENSEGQLVQKQEVEKIDVIDEENNNNQDKSPIKLINDDSRVTNIRTYGNQTNRSTSNRTSNRTQGSLEKNTETDLQDLGNQNATLENRRRSVDLKITEEKDSYQNGEKSDVVDISQAKDNLETY